MRMHTLMLGALVLAACGGAEPEPPVANAAPEIYRTVIEAEGIPFEIVWDRNDRSSATARVFGVAPETAIDPSNIIAQATGCRTIGVPERLPATDGVATYRVATECNPAVPQSETEAALSRELAREIDTAVSLVSKETRVVQASSAAAGVQVASLHKGSPFAAFDADDIERFCSEPWETRIGPDGRTEYNPCRRRDAFR